jgi:hypothetical protein
MNQGERIKLYLKTGKGLTGLDALRMFGCFRLGARVLELKQEGFEIDSQYVYRTNKFGEKIRVKKYYSAKHCRRF